MNIKFCGIFCVLTLIAPSAFPAPRRSSALEAKALTVVAKEALALAKTDQALKARLAQVVDNDTLSQSLAQIDWAKVPAAKLEEIRDTLDQSSRRAIMAKEFHNFFNPSADNDKNGTVFYAQLFKTLSETNNKNDQAAVEFENNHKEFCKIFCANANTTIFNLSNSLKQAYAKLKDNDTKKAVRPELEAVGKSPISKLKAGVVVTCRIKNNTNEAGA